MDIRINQSPLFNRLQGVGKTKRVDPAKQKDPGQDTPKFSDQLKMARKTDDEENQQNQGDRENQQEAADSGEHSQRQLPDGQSSPKPPDADTQDENEVGTNIDIKV